jgi:bifunctional DNA-binding transcriptional regulator/antitoxin component of YhaV-PrlF toxin-antitoxin module
MAKRKTESAAGVKFLTILTASTEALGWHFLIVSRDIERQMSFDGRLRRVVCSINGTEPFQCALLPSGDKFYIIVNKAKRTVLGIAAGDEVHVELIRDESKYGLPMPAEFREVLNQDPDGDRLFHALTPGKQRSVLYHVGKVRDIDKRIHISLIFIEHLKNNEGKIVNKTLMEELKRPVF